ncbi:hypothetical protein C8J55DRAFT_505738 [Lentinula edodes]|uniref:Uncharacterized protein n=1 Tax=Lentinula lateritia TaxID=40482 RepID=A0A9W9AVB8_9AGAR|nr:hypothetical protein C8J55DRAFT_505738 [Lentinula edodes]
MNHGQYFRRRCSLQTLRLETNATVQALREAGVFRRTVEHDRSWGTLTSSLHGNDRVDKANERTDIIVTVTHTRH